MHGLQVKKRNGTGWICNDDIKLAGDTSNVFRIASDFGDMPENTGIVMSTIHRQRCVSMIHKHWIDPAHASTPIDAVCLCSYVRRAEKHGHLSTFHSDSSATSSPVIGCISGLIRQQGVTHVKPVTRR